MKKIKGDRVRLGVVGLGSMGRLHARAIVDEKSPDFVLGAVADVFEASAKAAGAELGVPYFTSVEALYDSGLVDAVIIATPHYWHPVQTIQAARASLHVLCEKPLAVTVGPAREMVAECRRRKVAFGAMLQNRTRGLMKKVKQMVDGGELGRVYRVSLTCTAWYRTQAYYDSCSWRGTWDGEGGGILLNQAPHHLDIFQWLVGMPRSVTAFLATRLHKIEVENTAHAMMQYADGKIGTFYASTAACPGEEQLIVEGDAGTLAVEDGKLKFARLDKPLSRDVFENPEVRADFIISPKFEWKAVDVPAGGGQRIDVIKAFAAHILRGEPLVATGAESVNQLELTNAMYLSAFGRKTIDLPVDAAAIERLIGRLEREKSSGRGQGQRQASLKALRKLTKKK